uniref:Sodefrin-like protein n=1 Tax=Triturus carnifex TaxID=8326 RepID=Q8UVH1_TRICI|nr:sodefrin-like protein precursor [Triturus carnifex]
MRAILAAAAMLQALITGDCLFCEQCFALHTNSCSGIMTQCPPDVSHCVTGLENNILGSHGTLTAFKDCLDPSQKATCGRDFSFNTPAAYLWTSRKCCDSDFCNSGDVKGPPSDNTPNGYKCEGCSSDQFSKPCPVTENIQCTGKQNPVAPSMELSPGLVKLKECTPSKDALLEISAKLEFSTWRQRKSMIMV